MKAKLQEEPKSQVETESSTRGRKPTAIKWPRKREFSVEDAAKVNPKVAKVTLRNRLNRLTNEGKAIARSERTGTRSHPRYIFSLVA